MLYEIKKTFFVMKSNFTYLLNGMIKYTFLIVRIHKFNMFSVTVNK